MNEDRSGEDGSDRSWFDKLTHLFTTEPQNRDDLLELLRAAEQNEVIDSDALRIFEGAIQVSDMQVREIMIPRSQMTCIDIDDPLEDILQTIIRSAHSRFPVIGESNDDVQGVLLAKDMLPLILEKDLDTFSLHKLLRPAQVVPESKRVNVLLREFREKRNHMVLVIDEYGGTAGLVTIEDVLEEIVGEIEDEYDKEDNYFRRIADGDYYVKALMPIEEFNEEFKADLNNEEYDTIGGLITHSFGHVPQPNEEAVIDGYHFQVKKADNRQIHWLRMKVSGDPAA